MPQLVSWVQSVSCGISVNLSVHKSKVKIVVATLPDSKSCCEDKAVYMSQYFEDYQAFVRKLL